MADPGTLTRAKRWPTWWRRTQIWARRANLIPMLEVGSVVAFLLMTGLTWYKFSSPSAADKVMPTELTASLLIGTLVPAMAILVLLGRRLALKRASERAGGGSGQLHMR
ncbi:MAG TPA: PAS domain-containing sensor histidine kinase, partial [Novosphingobium sp.]|nr:PAS domain-containing sensor histidine kinase [Novosphingobium sp.]